MSEEGYNASAFLGWARNTGNIKVGKDGKPTIVKKINGHSCRLVAIKLNEMTTFLKNIAMNCFLERYPGYPSTLF